MKVSDTICRAKFGAHERWVRNVLELFPLPRPDLAQPFFASLQRIAGNVAWLDEAFGCDVAEILKEVVAQLRTSNTRHVSRTAAAQALVGDYLFTRTMIGSEGSPQPGADSLRAALWVCHHRMASEGDGSVPRLITELASAIRGAVRGVGTTTAPSEIASHFATIGTAPTVVDYLRKCEVFHRSGHAWICKNWKRIESTLIGEGHRQPPQAMPTSPPPSLPAEGGYQVDDDPEALIASILRLSTPVLDPDEPLLPEEPFAEVSVSTNIVPIPGLSPNDHAKHLNEYRARQAVWTQNGFLLTDHADVLCPLVLQRVLRTVLEALTNARVPELQLGLAALLLQAVTGRTSQRLLDIRVVDGFSVAPVAPYELSIKDRAFRVAVFFAADSDQPHGYFRPREDQVQHLEPVGKNFLLPLHTDVVHAIATQVPLIGQLSVEALDQLLRAAAQYVSQSISLPIAAGQVRRSFAAHLYELCRDTALVQLICADTLGFSEAPLHYYSPRVGVIGNIYGRLLMKLFSTQGELPNPRDSGLRVGSRLLLRRPSAQRLPKALEEGFPKPVVGPGSVHNAMAIYLGAMFLATAGHRPVNSLFRLTLGDIDLESGAALFADKVHDHAHDPRLAALPQVLVRQINAYLAHLQELAQRIPAIRAQVAQILSGSAPLLFRLTDTDAFTQLTMQALSKLLPREWTDLPLNWGRTWIRTRGIELGLPAELASIQLGHLDAVGYPFSYVSPTEPAAFIADVRPYMDRIVNLQEWRVRHGLGSRSACDLPTMPLRDWAQHVHMHEQKAKDIDRKWREGERSRMRVYKADAERYVLEHPDIQAAGIGALHADTHGPSVRHSLTKERADALCTAMILDAAPNVAKGLARAEVLFRILTEVNKRAGMQGEEPTRRLSIRRPVDNAFVPQMMVAVRQLRALRKHAMKLGGKPPNREDFTGACARVAYVLAVFGYCEDPLQIKGMLEHRQRAVRAASQDVVLAPWGAGQRQVVGLRGLAAVALARLARTYPEQKVPAGDEINRKLVMLLPQTTKSERLGVDHLALLCGTVSVANRYELSPAARTALHAEKGSVSAHPHEQIALLDAYPAGTLVRDWEGEVQHGAPSATAPLSRGEGQARTQYLALCRSIPTPGNDLDLPLSGKRVVAGQIAMRSTRALVIAEVRAQLDQGATKTLRPVVRLLAVWVLEMLQGGTHQRRWPADRTISTYLTRIGHHLVEIFQNRSLEDLDDAELEEAYLAIIESGTPLQNKAAKAAVILSFHDCCSRHFVFPDPDLSEIRAYLRSRIRSVDASLVLPSEREAIVAGLLAETLPVDVSRLQTNRDMRLVRQASAVMPLYAYGGARRSEGLGVRFVDIASWDEVTAMRIRSNPSRMLKTPAARRTVVLTGNARPSVVARVGQWIQADLDRLPKWRNRTTFVFSPLEDGRLATGRARIAETCIRACADVTQRDNERLHRFRHLVAFERITPLVLSVDDYRVWSKRLGGSTPASLPNLPLPRDLAGPAAVLGHANAKTTLQSYYHLPWLLRSRPDEIMRKRATAQAAAFAMGVSRDAVYKIQSSKSIESGPNTSKMTYITALLDHVLASLPVAEEVTQTAVAEPLPPRIWTAVELGGLLARAEATGSLDVALRQSGGHSEDIERIRTEARAVETRLGRRIIAGESPPGLGLPRSVARNLGAAVGLEALWIRYDDGTPEERNEVLQVAIHVIDQMNSKDHDVIKTQAQTGAILSALLIACLPGMSIEKTQLAISMVAIRVVRPVASGRSKGQKRYLGIAVKRALAVIWLTDRLNRDPYPKSSVTRVAKV